MAQPRAFEVLNDGLAIREARPDDAGAACAVLRASIVELCFADHEGDRDRLAPWLANKTPDNVRSWIVGGHMFLAERGEVVAGVAALASSGEITLLYVAPAHRFHGVSKGLLWAVEERARDLRLESCRVFSTRTAQPFYAKAGYAEVEPGAPRRLMTKRL